MTSYDNQFFTAMRGGSDRSAAIVVPLVLGLLKPASVVDIGCGEGAWLAQFMAAGITDVVGLDGDYVRPERLAIPRERFVAGDLLAPWKIDRRFDLALCLEVAEHLEASFADELVRRLVALAPVCLFSAAIPHQGGTHHVNEQWPDYWAQRFLQHGFHVCDPLRAALWAEPGVGYVYAQNMLVFASLPALLAHPVLAAHEHRAPLPALAKVHPRKWLKTVAPTREASGLVARARKQAARVLHRV